MNRDGSPAAMTWTL